MRTTFCVSFGSPAPHPQRHYSSEATGWTTEESDFNTAEGQEIFVFKASTRSLRPIHSCIQLVTVMLTPRLKDRESELTTYIYLVWGYESVEVYFHSSVCRYILAIMKRKTQISLPLELKCISAKPSQAKVLTGGGDLREAQVDVSLSVSHSCVWSQSWAQWQTP